jgi:PIN domain nuclease of toxin-antitoxin system
VKRLLLDTHVFLWWLNDDPALGKRVRSEIRDGRNQVYVSAASAWEISIKRALGKLQAPGDIESVVEDERFITLNISLRHGEQAGKLPPFHRDPFDRMLIAQAQSDGLILVTADDQFEQYGVNLMKAG